MQLNPQENFTIARGLEDHTDNTVLYVRAFIRDARTDTLLSTVDLANRGDNHRFSSVWPVPADPSGQGFYIVVTTSVYSDSSYTTKTPLYGDKYDEYLVMTRTNATAGIGGGGGEDVDYKKIQRIVQEELKKLVFPAMPEPQVFVPKEIDLSPILEALKDVGNKVNVQKLPDVKVDFSDVLAKLDRIVVKAANPQIDPDQLKPLVTLSEELTEMLEAKEEGLKETCEKIEDVLEKMKQFFGADVDRMGDTVKELKKKFDNVQYVVLGKKDEE